MDDAARDENIFGADEDEESLLGDHGFPREEHRVFTSDAALSLDEAQEIASERGVTLGLLMGEVDSGKSTLLVEMWTDFMTRGRIEQYVFAGSVTSLAFEKRAFLSRNESGYAVPETPRTQGDDDGWLHLRVQDQATLTDLLLADVTGEHFRHVREGVPLETELPFIGRVDRYMVIVDGAGIGDRYRREVTVNHATRLLRQLSLCAETSPTARIAILLTKEDRLSKAQRIEYDTVESNLLRLAKIVDAQAVALRVAARPHDHSDARGLEQVMAYLCLPPKNFASGSTFPVRVSSRSIGRFGA